MAWKRVPGLNGSVYVPDSSREAPRKHPCADCFSCQFCSDERCSVCRGDGGKCGEKGGAESPETEVPDGY